MLTLPLNETDTRLREVAQTAQREPVTLLENGKPLVIVVTPADLERLVQEQAERAEIVAEYDAYMEKVRREASPAVDELTDELVNQLVHELR